MKKLFPLLLVLVLFSFPTKSFAQQTPSNDELADRLCKCMESHKRLKGFARSTKCMGKLKKHFSDLTEEQRSDKWSYVLTKLAKNCAEYHYAFAEETTKSGEWALVNKYTETSVDSSCNDLYQYKKFYYLEPDTTWVTIKDGIWEEKIKKRYFSRLKFLKQDSCSFDLQFIESNHPQKKYYSQKDEIYHYTIKSKKENYFLVSITTAGVIYEFKLHFK